MSVLDYFTTRTLKQMLQKILCIKNAGKCRHFANLNMKKHWLINNILCEKLNSAKNLGVSSASVQRPLMNNFACSCLHMVPVNKLNDESQCFPRLRRIPYQCILFLHSRIIGSVPSSTGISGAAPLRMTNYDVITPVHS